MAIQPMKSGESRREYLERVRAFCKREYKKRRQTERCHTSHTACDVLKEAEKLFPDLGTFSVEGWCDDCGRDGISYLNAGDTYELTILFRSSSQRFFIDCWGDTYERWERAQSVA